VTFAAGDEEKEAEGFNPEAKKKFAEGNEHYAKGEYDAAIDSFKAAIALDPKLPGPYRNLGLAYRALNRCSDALPMYEKYLELKPESRFTERVRREIDLCRAKMGMQPLPEQPRHTSSGYHPAEAQSYLHVAANLIGGEATDEASVRVDGIIRGSTPITMAITPGKHRVHLERPGFEKADAVVDVLPGQRQDVELTMNKLTVETAPSVAGGETGEEEKKPKGSYRKYGWAMIGVAGALGLMGAGFGIAESQLHTDAIQADKATTTRADIDKKASTAANYATGAYIGLSVGAAALVAACIIFIVDPSRKETHQKQSYTIAPTITTGGAGIAAAGHF
jgi:tetratricopeptide (TPR) repeat protein